MAGPARYSLPCWGEAGNKNDADVTNSGNQAVAGARVVGPSECHRVADRSQDHPEISATHGGFCPPSRNDADFSDPRAGTIRSRAWGDSIRGVPSQTGTQGSRIQELSEEIPETPTSTRQD